MSKLPDLVTNNFRNNAALNPATSKNCCVGKLKVDLCFHGETVEDEDDGEDGDVFLDNNNDINIMIMIRSTINFLQHLRCWRDDFDFHCESFENLNEVASDDLCECHKVLDLNGSFFQFVPNLISLRIKNHECVGFPVADSGLNHLATPKTARDRSSEGEDISRSSWPKILRSATRAFACFPDSSFESNLSHVVDAIFELLKWRGPRIIITERHYDSQRLRKRKMSQKGQDLSPFRKTSIRDHKHARSHIKPQTTWRTLTLFMILCTILQISVEGFLMGRKTLGKLFSFDCDVEAGTHSKMPNLVPRSMANNEVKECTLRETPHAGRHFLPSHPAYSRPWIRRFFWKRRRRFMEGWYYRLTLKEDNVSFAFILSIEDPGIKSSDLSLACIQVVGPADTYLVQASKDDTKFWASKRRQAFGYTFSYFDSSHEEAMRLKTELQPDDWKKKVESGFQIQPLHLLGRVKGHDGSLGGVLDGQGIDGYCEFDIVVDPICGWGSCKCDGEPQNAQRSTGGWLSSFPIFEPHWQVTYADALASGTVLWNGTRYNFSDQPFYAEKNWGKSLPRKWYWTHCNSFDGYDQLSVTAGGGIRKLPFGQEEALGMVSVHHNGTFYEAVPWKGEMGWNVSTWGYWGLRGRCYDGNKAFAVEVTYECDPETAPGLVFRAPTPDEGMVYFCRDTFDAKCILSLWELEADGRDHTGQPRYKKKEPPIIDHATSRQGGAEIGGGPWWTEWKAKSRLKRVIKLLLSLPSRVASFRK